MSRIHSYSQIYALGHRAVADILTGPVVVQEKIDGSQFSFGAEVVEGIPMLLMRSKGAVVTPETTDKLFKPAVETAVRLFNEGRLPFGTVYRGEVISRPKHNVLVYDRIPVGAVILFDVDKGDQNYLEPSQVAEEAALLGLEAVPTFGTTRIADLTELQSYLDRVSCLGGAKIEGVVLKAYGRRDEDGKVLMAKYVSEAFKEVHREKMGTPGAPQKPIVEQIIEVYGTTPRYQKAVQHLRDAGLITDSPKDIGLLMKEIPEDILQECEKEIKDTLWQHYWPQIRRGLIKPVPQWYKDELAKTAFAPTTVADIIDPRPVIQEPSA